MPVETTVTDWTFEIDWTQWRSPYWASTIVKDQFDLAKAYADTIWNLAVETAADLVDDNFQFTPSDIEQETNVVTFDAVTADVPEPDINVDFDRVDNPVKPTLDSYPTINPVNIPTFTEEITVNIPEIPIVTWPEEPGDVPDVPNRDMPASPDVELPTVPVLEDITLPEAPTIQRPGFDAQEPVLSVTPPGNTFIYNEQVYQSALGDALDARLLEEVLANRTVLSDGTVTFGSGIPAIVENAIYERGLDRLQDEVDNNYREIEQYFSARGHEIPPGAMSGRLLEANKVAARQRLDHSNAVLVQAFEVAQKNNQFIISAGLQREDSLMQFANQVAQRAFETAKYIQEAAILVFNANLNYFNAQVELYKTKLAAYESEIRAEILYLEAYKTQLEGARIRKDLQVADVQIYTAQVGAVETLINLYRAQVDSVRIAITADAARVQAYGEKVRAYATAVGANTAKYDAYKAQITGEQAKVDVYNGLVRAFVAKVEGAKSQAQVNEIESRQVIEKNRALIEGYTADINKYSEEIKAILGSGQIQGLIFDSKIKAAVANIEALRSNNELAIKAQEVTIASINALNDRVLKQAEINIQGAIQTNALTIEAKKAGSSMASQLAASAMSSIHASAAMQHGSNDSSSSDLTASDVRRSLSFNANVGGGSVDDIGNLW